MGRITHLKNLKVASKKIQMGIIAGLIVVASIPFTGGPDITDAKAAMAGMPGGTPDYWTTPNYANSPLPEINEDGTIKQGTGMRKFVDTLPGLGEKNKNNLGQYIPIAVPDTTTYPGSDYYEISLVEYTEKMHSDLPATKLRGYEQTNTTDPTVKDKPSYFGPTIIAHKDRPVRIKFTNKLPTGAGGDLFLPVDTSLMGAGMGPDGGMYTQNRATLHLHGGITPWISDGTPHQWITPAGENTKYPKGVSVRNVPDMPDPGDGSETFYYSNQQSARLMFYHDHSYGITRLNVYAGEASGYMITDDVEQDLIKRGIIPDKDHDIPLVIQDKTFVPSDNQLAATDPTWDKTKWGGMGNLWFPHVYMPNQNPYDMSGANPIGRWDYGPWFWPPNTGIKNGAMANPLAGQPGQAPMNPGTPDISTTPEAFMDTPVVNGTAYPSITIDPKAYRFRILNGANDRMWNLQFYKAKSSAQMWNSDGTLNNADAGEVPMVPAVKTAGFPDSWPTDGRAGGVPDPAAAGPEMVQIANESGFLPKPAVLPNQPIDYEYGRRSITVLNVSSKTLLLGPAERADVVVDFSKYAGQTLILYNDSAAPVPAFDPRYDYYTGDPDQSMNAANPDDRTGGAPTTQPGYGPNTRTIMQIKVAGDPATTADTTQATLDKLNAEIPAAFDKGQNPLIYNNKVYGQKDPNNDPNGKWVNIQDNKTTFNIPGTSKNITMDITPKAIAEEFEQNYGRMNATLGTEMPNTNFQNQTTIMLGYVDPTTENMTDSIAPIGETGDGTQIWKITHNGVDTHAIHFHLFDVQLINRVGWDGSVRMPDENERGWKDTVRMNPLEDCIVALRPVAPKLPFGLPDSIRLLDPTMPEGSTGQFMNVDPTTGNPVTVTNKMTNFGWEYVWHCHLLGHEENDMMRSYNFQFNPLAPSASTLSGARANGSLVNLNWTDPTPVDITNIATLGNKANEVGYNVMRAPVVNGVIGTFEKISSVLANNISFQDPAADPNLSYAYRVDAFNAATQANSTDPQSMYNGGTPSNVVIIGAVPQVPAAPTNLTAVLSVTNANDAQLTWQDNATDETGYVVERSSDGTNFTALPTLGANTTTYTDPGLTAGTYTYRVKAVNAVGSSAYSNTASVTVTNNIPAPPAPRAPSGLNASLRTGPSVYLSWQDNASNETGFVLERSTDDVNFTAITTVGPRSGTGRSANYTDTTVAPGNTYTYRVKAMDGVTSSSYSRTAKVTVPSLLPATPTGLQVRAYRVGAAASLSSFWNRGPSTLTGYDVQVATDAAFTQIVATSNITNYRTTTYTKSGLARSTTYYIRVQAVNQYGTSAWSNSKSVKTP
ncbi:fibronectin type III domain-containing protein [Bacillus sp. EB600]|uniref:fibronectin type III domain-containing protein n=1 Tax=Bacillus sp. EB600 TaxID=2806345 RepID=UPI00210EF15A|nr:fibronectin type III domain-containing protein [Bacillus sp. EB600]MCQ6280286.1 fibronectin type III domain-containing protein [Bacillus sp. EB600]